MFGSGLNPVVVTEHARGKVEPAIRAAVEAIRINTSQDCIAPKVYAIDKSVEAEYFKFLDHELKQLKFGGAKDPNADDSPLTFSEEVTGIVEFRQKYSQYLRNPEAIIDPVSRRVDPHVFVFPFEKFAEVELKDHFAPILVHFTYSGKSQLEQIANDPRIRQRAMFASLFGDGAPDLEEERQAPRKPRVSSARSFYRRGDRAAANAAQSAARRDDGGRAETVPEGRLPEKLRSS